MGRETRLEPLDRVNLVEDIQVDAKPAPALTVLACDPEGQGAIMEMGDPRMEEGMVMLMMPNIMGGPVQSEGLLAHHLELPTMMAFHHARLE